MKRVWSVASFWLMTALFAVPAVAWSQDPPPPKRVLMLYGHDPNAPIAVAFTNELHAMVLADSPPRVVFYDELLDLDRFPENARREELVNDIVDKYRAREDVWRGLIAEIILHCIDVSNLDKENMARRLAEAAKQLGRFLGKSFLHALANTRIKVGEGIEAEIGGQAVRDIVEEFHRTSHPEKAFLNEFEAELNHWVTAFLPSWRFKRETYHDRIVLFIDDLDRCLPEVTLEVLEALKLYLNIPHLIFVVGLDRSVVDAVVSKQYHDQGVDKMKSHQYLNKMFQVELDIPPAERVFEGFLEKQIAKLNEVTEGEWSKKLDEAGMVKTAEGGVSVRQIVHDAIGRLAGANPRELKRLLNSTLLRARSAMLDPSLSDDQADGQKHESISFSQGAQSYLLQRLIRSRFVGEDDALRREETLLWLVDLSLFVRTNPSFDRKKDDSPRELKPGDSVSELDPVREEFTQLTRRRPVDRGGNPLPIDEIAGVWELLHIPFSAAVAAASRSAADRDEPKLALPEVLRNRLALALDKPADALTSADLLKVTDLDLSKTNISDLSPLAGMSGLTTLDLWGTRVSDLSPLAGLSGLTSLVLYNTRVSDLSPLAGLAKLKVLFLGGTAVSDEELARFLAERVLRGLWEVEIER